MPQTAGRLQRAVAAS